MRAISKQVQEEKAVMNTSAEESFSNVRTVKAFSNELQESDKFAKANDTTYDWGKAKSIWYGFFSCFVQVLLYGSMVGVIAMATWLYSEGKLNIGLISTFMFYMIMLLMNFGMLAAVVGNAFNMLGASDKIVLLMRYEPEINTTGGIRLEDDKTTGHLEIRNVFFNYPSKPDVEVLKGVSFTVDNNNKRVIALCGQSGCGKSSIVAMVERFYDPLEGQVLFNGQDIRKLEPYWYHQQIGIVQQEPVLFSGTIRENIIYGWDCKGLTEDQVVQRLDEATKMSNAYDFIHDLDSFPKGYDTVVGERGIKLSGGQKQRVAIARALIRKPKLLLLDEATSALDAESEHLVQQALDKLIKSGSQTVIVVAHRLSTIRDADEILVMHKGVIKERGTHNQLVAMNGVYKKLVSRQLVEGGFNTQEDEMSP